MRDRKDSAVEQLLINWVMVRMTALIVASIYSDPVKLAYALQGQQPLSTPVTGMEWKERKAQGVTSDHKVLHSP